MPLLQHYKSFVKQHPALVLNAERLLHWVAWNPERFSGSEYAYEAFNAAVGLLGIYNESILAEHPDYNATVAKWALWLAAVEQVQTLVELRAIQLEQRGKMSRYGPLIALELVKTVLRMRLWRSSKCSLALEAVGREDQEQHESEQQLKDLLQALTRLRQRYSYDPVLSPTPEHLQWNEQMARAQAVRAAALAPNRPPAACAAGSLIRAGSLGAGSGSSSSGCAVGATGCSSSRCLVCGVLCSSKPAGAVGEDSSSNSRNDGAAASASAAGTSSDPQHQQQHCCQSCGSRQQQQQQQLHSSSHMPGLPEIVPADPPGSSSSSSKATSSSSSKLRRGWWQTITGLYPNKASDAKPQQQGQLNPNAAGALPGSWGPGLRPYSNSSKRTYCEKSAGSSSSSGSAGGLFNFPLQQQQQLPWCLSNRDASIGHTVMWLGELVHVLRPLVYVCLLKRCGLTSWKPWVLSLGLDLASGYGLHTGHAILAQSNAGRWPAGSTLYSLALLRSLSSSKWSPGEQQELLGRRVALLRYMLRSPCYNAVTQRLLQKVVSGTRWAPGLSSLTEFAFNMVEGMQSYYTYVEV